jgi:uncharacterized phage infection (PIP) family protein YhgE
MSTTPDYKETLNKMATLEGLSKFISDSSATLTNKKASLITLLKNMQQNIGKVRSQIDTIKSSGATAKVEIQQLIKDADAKQQESLKNIQSNITTMNNLGELEAAVNELNNGITGLQQIAQGTYADAAARAPPGGQQGQWPRGQIPGQRPGGATKGGYTYGKSRRGRGNRRRRTKKSRRKGKR